MGRYLLKRLAQAVMVVISVTIIVFIVTRLIGDPVKVMLPYEATEENRAALEHVLGLDKPIATQLGSYLMDAARFDFGDSLWQRRPAMDIVFERLPATLELVFASFLLAVMIGIPLGIIASLRPGKILDRLTVTFSLAGLSFPQFWVGLMMIILFSVTLKWLPTSGRGGFDHLIMPAVVMALPMIGRIAMVTRSSMIDELNTQYVLNARAKGLSRRRVVCSYALKGSAIATLTVTAWEFAYALAGATVIVETVFAWPGLGFVAIQAIERQDLVLLQAIVFFVALLVVTINIIVDIIYKVIDPRVRLE